MKIKDCMTQSDLALALNRKCRITKNDAALVTDSLFNLMSQALTRRSSIKITGFGTFKIKTNKGRRIMNIKTKSHQRLEDYQVIRFLPCDALRKALKTHGTQPKQPEEAAG